jgi:NAD-dependent deacetylase
MEGLIKEAARITFESPMTIALTGAGISVESGIPDFRSPGGLWSKYDPAVYASINTFISNPEKVWEMHREIEGLLIKAEPNKAHIGLGELERMGLLHAVITQNVDNLHQAGGAKNVIEYHGNASTLTCLSCKRRYRMLDKRGEFPPRCECERILKPDVIFFGEAIPEEALHKSHMLASSAQALLVIGTSAMVSPANTIPGIAKRNGAKIIEINKERTHLTDSLTDIFLQGEAGELIERLLAAVKKHIP